MSALRVWLSKYRLPLSVTGGHFAVILVFCIFWSHERPPKKEAVIKVGLVSLASGGSPPSAAPPSPAAPAPTPPSSKQRKRVMPKPRPKTTSAKKKPAKPKAPSKPKWKPRSIEDIRKSAQTTTRRQTSTRRSTSSQNNSNLSKLKANLNRQLASGTHASTMLGEPASVPSSYLGQVQSLIYRKWHQPSRTEVGNRDHTVTIRLQIRKDGTLAGSQIVHRSANLVMNESVALLLRGLVRVPALPAEFKQSQLRLDIVLNLQ